MFDYYVRCDGQRFEEEVEKYFLHEEDDELFLEFLCLLTTERCSYDPFFMALRVFCKTTKLEMTDPRVQHLALQASLSLHCYQLRSKMLRNLAMWNIYHPYVIHFEFSHVSDDKFISLVKRYGLNCDFLEGTMEKQDMTVKNFLLNAKGPDGKSLIEKVKEE